MRFPNYMNFFFAPKRRLWVLVRTASASRSLRVSTINALRKHNKTEKKINEKLRKALDQADTLCDTSLSCLC